MSKIAAIILLLIINLIHLLLPQDAYAATCNFQLNTTTQETNPIIVKVTSNDLSSGTYRLLLLAPVTSHSQNKTNLNFTRAGLTVEFSRSVTAPYWPAGKYEIYLIKNNLTGDPKVISECRAEFTISDSPAQGVCTVRITNTSIGPDTQVNLEVGGLTADNYKIFINDVEKFENRIAGTQNLVLGTFDVGRYTVSIKNTCGLAGIGCLNSLPRLQCPLVAFQVAPAGSDGGGQVNTGAPAQGSPSASISAAGLGCNPETGATPGTGGVLTAIGCIPTQPRPLIEGLLRFSAGIGGGIAFLLMIAGVFQFITSAGNPDRLKKASEQITNAVIGLLFIIFSVLLLRIIGVNILGIL